MLIELRCFASSSLVIPKITIVTAEKQKNSLNLVFNHYCHALYDVQCGLQKVRTLLCTFTTVFT